MTSHVLSPFCGCRAGLSFGLFVLLAVGSVCAEEPDNPSSAVKYRTLAERLLKQAARAVEAGDFKTAGKLGLAVDRLSIDWGTDDEAARKAIDRFRGYSQIEENTQHSDSPESVASASLASAIKIADEVSDGGEVEHSVHRAPMLLSTTIQVEGAAHSVVAAPVVENAQAITQTIQTAGYSESRPRAMSESKQQLPAPAPVRQQASAPQPGVGLQPVVLQSGNVPASVQVSTHTGQGRFVAGGDALAPQFFVTIHTTEAAATSTPPVEANGVSPVILFLAGLATAMALVMLARTGLLRGLVARFEDWFSAIAAWSGLQRLAPAPVMPEEPEAFSRRAVVSGVLNSNARMRSSMSRSSER